MKRKLVSAFAITLSILYATVSPIYAATKETEVPITKDYTSCTFKITAEESGNYSAYLTSPSGEIYECSVIDDSTLSCMIDKVSAGSWMLTITDDSKSDLPKFSVSIVQTKESDTNAISGSITVGKDINGLSVYLKNDNIVAEWTDDTVGKVNVKVINLDTSETLSNETVAGKYFSCPIPVGTENIMINIVPSTSTNIDGATLSYTFKIDNYPDAVVIFPDYEYTNLDSVPVSVTLNETYSIYVEENNTKIYSDTDIPAGDYTYDIPVSYDGENAIAFYIVDENGNMRSTDAVFIKDTEAPELSLKEEYDGIKTHDSVYSITGTAKNFDSFTINDTSVEVATDGTFIYDLNLHVGSNVFTVKAADNAGNTSEYTFTITMLEQQKRSIPLSGIISITVVLAILLVFFITKKKKRQNRKKDITLHAPDINGISEEKKEVSNVKKQPKEIPLKTQKKIGNDKDSKGQANNVLRFLKQLFINSYTSTLIIVAVTVSVLFGFILQLGCVTSGSMEPTLRVGCYTIYNRLAYVVREPERGDIIIFKKDGKCYGKRVIGTAGDDISFADGYVYINGARMDESAYLDEDVETNCTKTFTVPEGCVFVLGDNRENSYDSRGWENPYISTDDIISKYCFTIPFLHISKYDE